MALGTSAAPIAPDLTASLYFLLWREASRNLALKPGAACLRCSASRSAAASSSPF